MGMQTEGQAVSRIERLESEIKRQRKAIRRLSLALSAVFILCGIAASNVEWVKDAWAALGTAPYLELGDSFSMSSSTPTILNSGYTWTEIRSKNSENTLKVMQESGAGIAVHGVNNGNGDAIHGWAVNKSGVYGESENGWGGEFVSGGDGGQIYLKPKNFTEISYSRCTPGELAVIYDNRSNNVPHYYLAICDNDNQGGPWDAVKTDANP